MSNWASRIPKKLWRIWQHWVNKDSKDLKNETQLEKQETCIYRILKEEAGLTGASACKICRRHKWVWTPINASHMLQWCAWSGSSVDHSTMKTVSLRVGGLFFCFESIKFQISLNTIVCFSWEGKHFLAREQTSTVSQACFYLKDWCINTLVSWSGSWLLLYMNNLTEWTMVHYICKSSPAYIIRFRPVICNVLRFCCCFHV